MKHVLTLCLALLLAATTLFSQKQTTKSQEEKHIDSLLKEFNGHNYDYGVKLAKPELENYQKKIIPKTIALLYNTSKVGIKIYEPGIYFANGNVSNYKGVGGTIPYNVDWLSIRAGWLLEALTFNDFGYSSKNSNKKSTIYDTKIVWEKIATAASLKKDRKIMADKVAAWWQKNETTWTRLGALKEALQSNNEVRYTKALVFLTTYENRTECDGLTKEAFDAELKPLVKKLKTNDEHLKVLIKILSQDSEINIYFKKAQ